MSTAIEVRAPCRLHFGMFSCGHPDQAQYGGVGAMIEPPGVEVKISPASRFEVRGTLHDRTRHFVELTVSRWNLPEWPACEIVVQSARSHTGLGVGTQLGLAIATGLRRFLHLPDLSAEKLATSVGRGLRSAVGTHGFQHGGLIVDAGKEPGQAVGKLAAHAALPDCWRFVLVCPAGEQGLAGTNEATAFARLPPVSDEITRELWAITNRQLLPAVERHDCTMFGEAVYQFGRLAGECFSAAQGGPFASAEIARLVESIRKSGVPGAGQTSWGPTVFAVTASEAEAQQLADWVRGQACGVDYEITVARPNNTGATIG